MRIRGTAATAVRACHEQFNVVHECIRELVSQLRAGTAQARGEGGDHWSFMSSCCVLLDFNAEHRSCLILRNQVVDEIPQFTRELPQERAFGSG